MTGKDADRQSEESFQVAHAKMSELLAKERPLEAQDKAELHCVIQGLVEDAVRSKSRKELLLSIKGNEAVAIMDWLHNVSYFAKGTQTLSHPCLQELMAITTTSSYQRCLRRLLVKLSKASGALPPSLLLHGIVCCNRDSVAGGGFADIFCGAYDEKPVALKRLRVFKTDEDLEKSRSVCVSHIY